MLITYEKIEINYKLIVINIYHLISKSKTVS